MTARLRIHPAVYAVDLRQAVAYYRDLDSNLPERLSQDFEDRLDLIEDHPLAGRPLFDLYRRVVLRRFPYLVAYAVDGESAHVLAVVHGMRHPESIRTVVSARQ